MYYKMGSKHRLKLIPLFALILIFISLPLGASTYLGEFTIGEAFVDEYVIYADGSLAKISVVFKGSSGNVILLYVASLPETPYVIASGYCFVEKKSTESVWTFLIGFGVTGDRIYKLQKNNYNQIKVWRMQ